MINIVQIEELVYGRLKGVNKAEWIKMLSNQGISADVANLRDDYVLLEQTDYRFTNGKHISSERIVYNTDWNTYFTAENGPEPENTDEIITVHYDSSSDRYFVYYTHYPIVEEQQEGADFIFSEADMPIVGKDIQALPESIPLEENESTAVIDEMEYAINEVNNIADNFISDMKPWRKRTLRRAKEMYLEGRTAGEICAEIKCSEAKLIAQLSLFCGIQNPFDPTSSPQPIVHESGQTTLIAPTPPQIKDKQIGRCTWDGDIVLSHLYNHPGATAKEIATSNYAQTSKSTIRDINRCLRGYCSVYVEKIPQTGGYRLNQKGIEEIRPYIENLGTPEITLDEYKPMMQHMNRSKQNGNIAPHKVILMLAIIRYHMKYSPRVMEVNEVIRSYFMDYWRKYVHSTDWSPNILTPWEYMDSEPFWHWVKEGSIKKAYLDEDLYYLLHYNDSASAELIKCLKELL